MKAEENIRQVINKILHSHIDVNKHEDYTNYKKLITDIENLILQQRKEAEREAFKAGVEAGIKWSIDEYWGNCYDTEKAYEDYKSKKEKR